MRVFGGQANPSQLLQYTPVNECPVQRVRLLCIVVGTAVSHSDDLFPKLACSLHCMQTTQKRGAAEVGARAQAWWDQTEAQQVTSEDVGLDGPSVLVSSCERDTHHVREGMVRLAHQEAQLA